MDGLIAYVHFPHGRLAMTGFASCHGGVCRAAGHGADRSRQANQKPGGKFLGLCLCSMPGFMHASLAARLTLIDGCAMLAMSLSDRVLILSAIPNHESRPGTAGVEELATATRAQVPGTGYFGTLLPYQCAVIAYL